MVKTNLWTKNGSHFVKEGCNLYVGKKKYGNIRPETLYKLGYRNKVIEYITEEELGNYTNGFVTYPDGNEYWVSYELEVVEPIDEPIDEPENP